MRKDGAPPGPGCRPAEFGARGGAHEGSTALRRLPPTVAAPNLQATLNAQDPAACLSP